MVLRQFLQTINENKIHRRKDKDNILYDKSNALDLAKVIQDEHIPIYNQASAHKLMKCIGKHFDDQYSSLEETIKCLSKFDISNKATTSNIQPS